MKQLTCKWFLFGAILASVLASSGCHKKTAQAPPPPPPAPPAPTATLAANPAVIEQGQSTTLTWQTNNATDVNIAGIGTVMASGSRTIAPESSTTYTLTAKGPGGTRDTSTRVTVNAKVAQAQAPTPSISDEELFARNVKDVLFDYDKSNFRVDQTANAQSDAAFLAQHPSIKVVVEGHCDDRGSEEYNLALGTHRAESLKRSLLQQGVSADRIRTISYGKEKPFCNADNETCWQRNRVDHFTFAR